jgi:hypothetical protein
VNGKTSVQRTFGIRLRVRPAGTHYWLPQASESYLTPVSVVVTLRNLSDLRASEVAVNTKLSMWFDEPNEVVFRNPDYPTGAVLPKGAGAVPGIIGLGDFRAGDTAAICFKALYDHSGALSGDPPDKIKAFVSVGVLRRSTTAIAEIFPG